MVTVPGFTGCRYCRWLPRVRASDQPFTLNSRIASLTLGIAWVPWLGRMGQVVLGAAGRSLGNRQGTIAVGVVFAGLDGSVEGGYRVYNGHPPPPPGLSPVPINLATRLSRSNQNGAPSDTAAAVTNHPSTCAIQPPVPQSGRGPAREGRHLL